LSRKHFFLVPVEEVSREVSEEERVAVNQNRDKVVGSPDFDPDEVPDLDLQRAVTITTIVLPPRGAVLRRTLENR
jgi:hypothetical protein